ncbi:hypothetical protein BJ546DRAFT_1025070 [Cryomyces antarcticus]
MDRLLSEVVASERCSVDWYGKMPISARLRDWVDNVYIYILTEAEVFIYNKYRSRPEAEIEQDLVWGRSEMKQWRNIALGRLGMSRVKNLFDYVVSWDNSVGAILDLKDYITLPGARTHLTDSFIQQLSRRLLHAGATTTNILDVYFSVIHAFKELDPKGVLLSKVARPIRHYLRDRDDAVRIVASSCLADVNEEGDMMNPSPDICSGIAIEICRPISNFADGHGQKLDWDDMEWMPAPVDAEPEYKKAKADSIVPYFISLFNREEFIKELQNILGEHLLKSEDQEFEKEIRLLELLKTRFGSDKLQACEVMLKDVLDSKRMNAAIRNKQAHGAPRLNTVTDMHAQILSSFFWPALREDTFAVPTELAALQESYAAGFESIKSMRKLNWLPALGRTTVELQLQDRRVVVDNVQIWQASVVYAFQDPNATAGVPVTRTVQELEEQLEMEEPLVRNAVTFWVGKMVLKETATDAYTVLETLSSKTTEKEAAAAAEAAEQSAGVSAIKTHDDLLEQNKELYEQMILSMLTNGGIMDGKKVTMMLKFVVPGGFPFGEDEVGTLMRGMVEAEKLDVVGGGFAVRKG